MPKRQRCNEPTAVPHEYERDDDVAAPADSMRPENAGAAAAENWRWASWEQAEAVPDAAAERPEEAVVVPDAAAERKDAEAVPDAAAERPRRGS